jgi:amidase
VNDLVKLTARQAVDLLKNKKVSPLELIDAALERIDEADGAINALPTICADRAKHHARNLMDTQSSDDSPRGQLYGLPVAIKDLKDVAGVRSTKGSPIYADHVPETSDRLVTNIESRGGVILAKSNTPEFGAGANTFNEVFGKTRNPWDTDLTCGGSSGGSGAALAAGEIWLATGSDFGGSLRIPASYCSVVGLRPTPGRVSHGPQAQPYGTLSVEGPMGRNVGDVALLLDTQSGSYAWNPQSLPAPHKSYVDSADSPIVPTRVAYTPDLGVAMVDSSVAEVCRRAMSIFETMGSQVDETTIELGNADEVFQTLRGAQYVAGYMPLLEQHRDLLKDEVIWNIEHGLSLTPLQIGQAEVARGGIINRTAQFFETYDVLVCPTVLAPPFDVDIRYLTEVEGTQLSTYIGWLFMTYALTLTGCPIISVPCGFTESGLPVGIQIMAPWKEEGFLISVAAAFEQAVGISDSVPLDPRSSS